MKLHELKAVEGSTKARKTITIIQKIIKKRIQQL